jgi:hypothetical protein
MGALVPNALNFTIIFNLKLAIVSFANSLIRTAINYIGLI